MALISVIIPCYNVGQYIDRCMESVVKQTIKIENLEIILINDASTDETLGKLYEWEARYPENIMVINYEENLRQGGARNVGMQYATSEYIGFVDADDWLELDAYEKLYEKVQTKKYDKVSGKFVREKYPGEKNLLEEKGEWGSICTSIYLRQIIVENNIWFPEKIAYEDNYWSAIMKLYVSDACVVDTIIYHYFINNKSTVTTRNAEHHFDRLDIEVEIVEEYKRRGVFELYKEELEAQFVQRFYLNTMYIFFTQFDYIPSVIEDMRRIVLDYFPDFKNNTALNKCNEREKVLLRLLEIARGLSEEEWIRIKLAYLKTF